MHIASVEELAKSYGERKLFAQISFNVNEGDKIALIARNGQGKTSLLNILAGLDSADQGKIWIHKDIPIVYLQQEHDFSQYNTLAQAIESLEHPLVQLYKKYTAALEQNTQGAEMEKLLEQMNALNAWQFESDYKEIIGRLKLPDAQSPIASLSGGQKKRLALAISLLQEKLNQGKCLYILDEPTNHLDVEMIEWLEKQLSSQKTTLILVSHDRYFIDNVCNVLLEIEDNKAYKHSGNYEDYLANKAHRIEVNESERAKDLNIFRRELEWMRKQPKARTTKSKSREDSYYELEEKLKQGKSENTLQLEVKMNRIGGKILEMKKVYKSFGDKKMLNGFDYTFKKGERVGIVGKNGVGKSTFLKIALGDEAPDSGKINHGETIIFGHFSQNGLNWTEDKRVIEYVKAIAEYFPLADGSKVSASVFLERFGFMPEQQHTFLSKLSGGEKKRVQLLSILFKNPNFLILDEPTNDLDLQSLQLLENFLLNYPGCLILVSHDRYFMDKLVDHLFIFEGEGVITDFPGNFTQYRMHLQKNKEGEKNVSEAVSVSKHTKEKKQISYKEKLEWEQLEKRLPEIENEKIQLHKRLQSELPYAELEKITLQLSALSQEQEEKEMRWLELSEKFE